MEGAGVRRAVAEERDGDARLVAQLEREAGAYERRQPAADDRVRAEVAALDVVEVHRAAVTVRAALDLAVELRHQRVRVRAARERVAVRAMGRAEDVAVLHRGADTDLGRLLADRDMQEAGQLAGAEALLDLLLETPDQQHLAQEVAEPILGQGAPLFDLRHGSECTFCARWHSQRTGRIWRPSSRRAGSSADVSVTLEDATHADRAAALLAPLQPSAPRPTRSRSASSGPAPAPSAESLRRGARAARRGAAPRRARGSGAVDERPAEPEAPVAPSLPASWDAALATLPADWSDLLGEVELDSSDYLDRARCTWRRSTPPGRRHLRLQFRSASRFGYGASPGMVRRCLERCDAAGIAAASRPARALGHPPGRHPGTGLANRRPDGLSEFPRRAVASFRKRLAGGNELALFGAEALGEPLHDLLAQTGRVFLGERPLGRLVGDRERDRLAALADLVTAVDVEDADLAELPPGRLAGGGDELAGRDILGDGDGDVLADRGVGDHVAVGHGLVRGGEEVAEVELEGAPLAVELARMELAEDAGGGSRGLARVEQRMRSCARRPAPP